MIVIIVLSLTATLLIQMSVCLSVCLHIQYSTPKEACQYCYWASDRHGVSRVWGAQGGRTVQEGVTVLTGADGSER